MAPKFAVSIHHDSSDLLEAPVTFSASGVNQIIAGVPSMIIRVYKIFFIVSAATAITYQDGGNNLTGALGFSSNEGMVLDFDTKPWFTMGTGNAFNLNSSNAVQVSGAVYYTVTNA